MNASGQPKIIDAKLFYAGICRTAKNIGGHAHGCMELILINDGACDLHVGSRTLHAESGEIITMPAHEVHDQVSNGYIDTVYCGFMAPSFIDCLEPQVIPLLDARFIVQCMQLLAAVSLNQICASPDAVASMLATVLEELRHQNVLHQESNQMPHLLRRTLRYMNDHLDQPISLDTLVEHTHMSVSYLQLLFRSHLGTSPMRYLHNQRMHVARTALQTPYLSVKEVAVICGYPDANHFVRTFRKVHGLPPGQWRKQQEMML